jgi:hypothetical protein
VNPNNRNGSDIWQDREDAVVRSIMSGNNACGTLRKALETGKLEEFLRRMVRPTLQVCAGEQADLRQQRDAALQQSEARRQVLADVAANAGLTGELAGKVDLAARVTA